MFAMSAILVVADILADVFVIVVVLLLLVLHLYRLLLSVGRNCFQHILSCNTSAQYKCCRQRSNDFINLEHTSAI